MSLPAGSWKAIAVFAGVGPLIGALLVIVLVLAVTMIAAPPEAAFQVTGLLIVLVGLIVGWLFGLIPAAITGWIMATRSPRITTPAGWVGQSSLAGFLCAALLSLLVWPLTMFFLLGGTADLGDTAPMLILGALIQAVLYGVVGAISGAACAGLTITLRPTPNP